MEGDKPQIDSSLMKSKLIFLGDESVGKTSIITRFIYDVFDSNDNSTVGVDFISHTLNLDNRAIRLQLWDAGGKERFRSLIPSYIRDCSVAIIVYDVTSKLEIPMMSKNIGRNSFNSIKKWVEDVRKERGKEAILMIVGNKTDLADRREITKEEGAQIAKEMEATHFEVSAKLGTDVKNLFHNIASGLKGSDAHENVK